MDNQAFQSLWLIAQSMLLPTLVFVCGFLVLRRWAGNNVSLGIGASAGVLTGWFALFGPQASFPPQQALDWLPFLLIAAGIGQIATIRMTARVRHGARLVVLAAGIYLLSPPLLREQEVGLITLEWLGALAIGALLLWALLYRLEAERASAAIAAAFGGLGFVVSLGGSIVIGGIANAAFAIAALAYLGQATHRLPRAGSAIIGGAAVLWVWIAFSARHLAEVNLTETLLCAAAAAAAAIALDARSATWLRRFAAAVLPPATPAVLAVGIAIWRYLSAQSMGY